MRNSRVAGAVCLILLVASNAAAADAPEFKHPLDGQPVTFTLKPGETETTILKEFKATGKNGYREDAQAIADGKALYEKWCQSCHNPDGKGKLAPPLVGKDHVYEQTQTDAGMFTIIYAGASGAMQPFSKHDMTQDQMLRIIAYVRTLDK